MNQLRRSLLVAPLAIAALGMPAFAEALSLNELSRYLNALTTAETTFTQVNADGSQSSGKIYIRRPNRMRFEYAPPNASLVLASAGQVAIFDNKSNQPPEQYPLRRTPLNLILARNINLGRANMVVGHQDLGNGTTAVIAQDPEHPEYGTLQMDFTANPTQLRGWIVTDETGNRTTVRLGTLTVGQEYAPSLFSITAEENRRR
jgi:outer membrane lipoprotein-sorting protein